MPFSARSFASSRTLSIGRLLKGPRISGIAQYVQQFEQPSAILRYAQYSGVVRTRAPERGRFSLSETETEVSSEPSALSTISTMFPLQPIPTMASTSGSSAFISSVNLSARQPVTIIFPISPASL